MSKLGCDEIKSSRWAKPAPIKFEDVVAEITVEYAGLSDALKELVKKGVEDFTLEKKKKEREELWFIK